MHHTTHTIRGHTNPLQHATPQQLAQLDHAHSLSRDEKLLEHIHAAAGDVGRLRRRFNSNPDTWTGAYIVDRIAEHVGTLIGMLEPSAAELAAWYAPGDPDAVDEAIRIVDARYRSLQQRLGNTNGC